MSTQFYKYQGTGNDFILIDNRTATFKKSANEIAAMCLRRFGIGADGMILLENVDGYDFKMIYFNADGNEGSMCGNGGRCIVKFAHDLGIIQDETSFVATDGPHAATVKGDIVSLKMIDVFDIQQLESDSFINTGSPHLIREVADVENFDVFTNGRAIRTSKYWMEKGGVNVNFFSRENGNELFVRTFERGVEDETYSCGTGVTAAAIHAVLNNGLQPPVAIKTLGGNLSVDFSLKESKTGATNVYLSGPARLVFSGEI